MMGSTVMNATPVAPSAADLAERRGWRTMRSKLMSALLVLSFVIVLIPLGLIAFTVVVRGAKAMSWSFLTSNIAVSERRATGGIGPAIVGTVITTAVATAMAVPLGILGAVFLNEYGGTRPFARLVRFLANVMTGVPSIVMGLFIYVIWTVRYKQSSFGASLALACLMLPIIIRSTEEMLRLVPDDLREAALALGSSKSKTIITIALPAALPGITSGVLLAVARAAGETAPLLFTIGAAKKANLNPFQGVNTALPLQIFSNANSSFDNAVNRGWGAALTLVVIAFAFTLVARVVSGRFGRVR